MHPARGLVATAALVLLLHVALLGALPEGGAGTPDRTPLATPVQAQAQMQMQMQFRQIVLLATQPPVVPPSPTHPPHHRGGRPPLQADAPALVVSPAAGDRKSPATTAASNSSSDAPSDAPSDTASDTTSDTASRQPSTPTPVYSTLPAPAATLVFDMKRGLAAGRATLHWQPQTGPDGKHYTLTLQAQAFGMNAAAWTSSGGFDDAGLAPERYAESRRGREVRATNFQRAVGKISFSAQSSEFELAAGAQDRSSWMLQLGAVLNANPALAQPGAQTTLVVAGTRGAPEPWVFTVVGRGPVTLALADVAGAETGAESAASSTVADAVQLLREPRQPYGTRARIWLDPARHHLPVKVQLRVQGQGQGQGQTPGEGQEFELRHLTMP